jgi:hypothetical protein
MLLDSTGLILLLWPHGGDQVRRDVASAPVAAGGICRFRVADQAERASFADPVALGQGMDGCGGGVGIGIEVESAQGLSRGNRTARVRRSLRRASVVVAFARQVRRSLSVFRTPADFSPGWVSSIIVPVWWSPACMAGRRSRAWFGASFRRFPEWGGGAVLGLFPVVRS